MNSDQLDQLSSGEGFVAALDQSGGSTPKALRLYGVPEDAYSGEDEMFDLVHRMRTRIMTNPAFTGDRILAAILFEQTMDRQVEGVDTAAYLWGTKRVVPILKVDKGLAAEANGAQVMKPLGDLDGLLERAVAKGIFGTKMRSVINSADEQGIRDVVDQQFEVARQIIGHDLVPIIEPEINIKAADKADCEHLLKPALEAGLAGLGEDQKVMFKLTLPEQAGFYTDLTQHPAVVRVVALSGGYSRAEANARLAENPGVIASFSRALTEGLRADQSEEDFTRTLNDSIESIFQASRT